MDIASQMVLFTQVIKHGSFSAAARALTQSPSAVSKQIGHLEDRLGVRLLHRSTRSISLTEEGRTFYERCAAIAQSISEAESLVMSMGDHAQGPLHVAATVAFAKSQLLPILPDFLQHFPDVHLMLELTDRRIDMVAEEVDVAIRFTEQINDASVIARKLAPNRRVICAAPSYIERHGMPDMPEDLVRHNCLRISTVASWNDWEFERPAGTWVLRAAGNFEANSADAVYHATLAGVGIACLSTYLVGPDLHSGRLVRLLPEHTDHNSQIVAIYPNRRNLSPKVRVFIDYLTAHFGPVPPWERQ